MATAYLQPSNTYTRDVEKQQIVETYNVHDATDIIDASTATGIPSIGDRYPGKKMRCVRKNVEQLRANHGNNYIVVVTYERSFAKEGSPEAGDESWEFEFSETSIHIDTALAATPYGTDAPAHGRQIGVNSDGKIDGVDIKSAAGRLIIKRYYSSADAITGIATWEGLLNRTNAAIFKNVFAAGTLLFTSFRISPSMDTDNPTEVTFTFDYSRNLTYSDLPSFTTPTGGTITITGGKTGHQYMWAYHVPTDGTGSWGSAVTGVYVDTVYMEGDYSLFGFEATLTVTDD